MNVWPVIIRELRAQARQVFTFWLRVLGVMTLLAGAVVIIGQFQDEADLGGILFGWLHLMGYLAIWLLVPLGAADCISRERREGTLGLLFLTPLKPAHIVIAKGIAHCLRALTLVLATVPVLTIPFLLGGVTWQQALISVTFNLSAVCWCLAAALVASSLARHAGRAMSVAMLLGIAGFCTYLWVVGALLGMNSQTTWSQGYSQSTYDFFAGFGLVAMDFEDWTMLLRVFKLPQILAAVGMSLAFSGAILVFAVLFAANRLRRSWRDEPPSVRAQKLEQAFCKPMIGVGLLRRWMARKLERNPIGWLQQRRWSGRMVMWIWFAIVISLYSVAVTDANFFRKSEVMEKVAGWSLVLSMAATTVGSFRSERASGVLELLLVSPLSAREIVNGRLRGLWGQFLPAILALLGIWLYFLTLYRGALFYGAIWGYADIWFFSVTFLVTPVVGLYFSLRCQHYLVALLLTLLMAVTLPLMLAAIVRLVALQLGFEDARNEHFTWMFQCLLGGFLLMRLYHKLEHRSFPLERPAS